MSDIKVRRAAADDVGFILDSNLNMAAETEDVGLQPQRLRGGIEYLLGHPQEGLYLVAERGAVPVGTLMITFEWSDWRNGRFWWIQSVYVPSTHRRQGVYRAMHEAVRQLAHTDPQACGLRLYVERENTTAQRTYQHIGMSETHYRLYEELLRPTE